MESILTWQFGEVIIYMAIVFFWLLVIWMFIAVFTDIFRRRDLSGIAKAFWVFFIFVLPLFGILIYVIVRPKDATAEQDQEMMLAARRAAGYSAAEEIAKAQELLNAGALTQAEFDAIKQQALS
jgi:predicted membrane channel-forming protein YqfA (hemolysin III family)